MVDLHSHILPDVDDGSRNMEETIRILKKASNAGFDTICATPHYIEPEYLNNKIQNEMILEEIKRETEILNIPINLLLGNEVFIRDNIDELIEKKEIATLNDTKYVLIELPMYQEMPKKVVDTMLDPIREKGFKIVIAHPERYTYIQRNPDEILNYFSEDIIFQGNYASIIGAYGRSAQKTIEKLLDNKIINYLSSDVHHAMICFYDDMKVIKKKLLKIIDKEYYELITEINPKLIIENKDIERI